MHIHILGICGTFMGGVAALAQALGHRVTGSDKQVYPPMSTQLADLGITLFEGYQDLAQFHPTPDIVLIGNAMSRGNPAVEYVLDHNLAYTSGPQWLWQHLLKDRWVLAVAGTHGKTSVSSMLAWILQEAGLAPGFLIGGLPGNFGVSASVGDSTLFVIEADEYDTAFFDKRSKFVHYRPKTLVINNVEFDHADIFASIADIQRQFHHLIRMVPSGGMVLAPAASATVEEIFQLGIWSQQQYLGKEWSSALRDPAGNHFDVLFDGSQVGTVAWSLLGEHNVNNALMAIAAARHVGVQPATAAAALAKFKGVKRRLEVRGQVNGVTVYDDFAHHPTAIATTLAGIRAKVASQPVIALLELRSNTMRQGHHSGALMDALKDADVAFIYRPETDTWAIPPSSAGREAVIFSDLERLIQASVSSVSTNSHLVVMSNGGFGGIHERLLEALAAHPQLAQ